MRMQETDGRQREPEGDRSLYNHESRERKRSDKKAQERERVRTHGDCTRMNARSTEIALAHTYAYAREGWKAGS